MKMRKIAYAMAGFALWAAHAQAASPQMTEARNAAVGFAITHQLVISESLGSQCRTLNSVADQADQAYRAWDARNTFVTRAAWAYLSLSTDAIAGEFGETAAQKFSDERKAEFANSTRKSLSILFAGGVVDVASCRKIIDGTNEGIMDIRNQPEFYQTLQQMGDEIMEMQKQ